MAASKELFLLKKSDAKILRTKLDECKHQKNEFHFGISYSFLTSVQIFLIGQYSCFTKCIKNGKKKRKIITDTQKLVAKQSDVMMITKQMWYFMNQQKVTHKEQLKHIIDQRQKINLTDDDDKRDIVYEMSDQ